MNQLLLVLSTTSNRDGIPVCSRVVSIFTGSPGLTSLAMVTKAMSAVGASEAVECYNYYYYYYDYHYYYYYYYYDYYYYYVGQTS